MRRIWPTVRGSVRARMTLLYSGVFTVITVGVLIAALRFQQGIVDDKLDNFRPGSVSGLPCNVRPPDAPCSAIPYDPSQAAPSGTPPPSQILIKAKDDLQQSLVSTQRIITLIAIAAIPILALAVCWWVTGRL